MCCRYVLASKVETIERRFDVECNNRSQYKASYNISEGKKAWVIPSFSPNEMMQFVFGYTPIDSKSQTLIVNARAEGNKNKTDDPDYAGGKGIVYDPNFRNSIRSQRCLVIADAFYEGSQSEGLKAPYLVFLKAKTRPFAFAGVWQCWTHPRTKEKIYSFAILTCPANRLLLRVGSRRCPVILNPGQEKAWLRSSTSLGNVTAMLKPYPAEYMDAWEVSDKIQNAANDYPGLLDRTGRRLGEPLDKLRAKIALTEGLIAKERVNVKRPQTDRDNELIAQLRSLKAMLPDMDDLPL